MKNKKGFIQIPILLVVVFGILLVSGAGYVGVKQYQKHQAEGPKQEPVVQNEQATSTIELSEIDKLRQEVEALKSIKQNVPTEPMITKVPIKNAGDDLPSVINKWKDRIAEVTCEFAYSNGVVYARSRGSGTIFSTNALGVIALTNLHVVTYAAENGTLSPPSWCNFKVYGVGERKVFWGINKFLGDANSGLDWSQVVLANAEVKTDNEYFTNLPSFQVCTTANLGDKVIVLGYPTIGTSQGITVTEGIISGVEENEFITSAKIDHGNSGGTAILVKDDCYLGIPTRVAVGEIESLGRIISGKYIFTQ